MPNYTIHAYSSGLWLIPSGAPTPDASDHISVHVKHVDGPALKKGNSEQNISSQSVALPKSEGSFQSISLTWTIAGVKPFASVHIPKETWFATEYGAATRWEAWKTFLSDLDTQEPITGVGKQYAAVGGARMIAAAVLEQLPLPVDELSTYHLGISNDPKYHFIDLKVGMRLKVSYSNWQNDEVQGAYYNSYSGNGTSYFSLTSSTLDNGLRIDPFLATQNVLTTPPQGFSNTLQPIATMLDLASQTPKPHHRLYFPAAKKYVALDETAFSTDDRVSLLSTYCFKTLHDNVPSTEGGAQETCTHYAPNAVPSVFFGDVDITPEILVVVNGEERYVAVGTTLRNLFEEDFYPTEVPAHLTFNRYCAEELSTVTIPAEHAVACLDLPVQRGDQIAWLASGEFTLEERVQAIFNSQHPANATALAEAVVKSFGGVNVPTAGPLCKALLELKNSSLGFLAPAQIGPAIFGAYPSITGPELVNAFLFAGFDPTDVGIATVTGWQPTISIEQGAQLFEFLNESQAGYDIFQLTTAAFDGLYKVDVNAPWMVTGMINASVSPAYTIAQISEGVLHAVASTGQTTEDLAADLMIGSTQSTASQYTAANIAPAMMTAYPANNSAITFNELVDGLADALVAHPNTTADAFAAIDVAQAAFAQFPSTTPEQMMEALKACTVNYSMRKVARATYKIDGYTSITGGQLDGHELAHLLVEVYGSAATLNNVAQALVYADKELQDEPGEVAELLEYAFDLTETGIEESTTAIGVVQALQVSGFDYGDAATGLVQAFPDTTAGSMAYALMAGYTSAYNKHYKSTAITALEVSTQVYKNIFKKPTNPSQQQVTTMTEALAGAFGTGISLQDLASAIAKGFGFDTSDYASNPTNLNYLTNALALSAAPITSSPALVAGAVANAFGMVPPGNNLLPAAQTITSALGGVINVGGQWLYDLNDIVGAVYSTFNTLPTVSLMQMSWNSLSGRTSFTETKLTVAVYKAMYASETSGQMNANLQTMTAAVATVFDAKTLTEEQLNTAAVALATAFSLGTPAPTEPEYGYDLAYALYHEFTHTGSDVIEAKMVAGALKAAFPGMHNSTVSDIIAEVFGIHTGSLTDASLEELATAIVQIDPSISDSDLATKLHDQFYLTDTQADVTLMAVTLNGICSAQYIPDRTTSMESVANAILHAFGPTVTAPQLTSALSSGFNLTTAGTGSIPAAQSVAFVLAALLAPNSAAFKYSIAEVTAGIHGTFSALPQVAITQLLYNALNGHPSFSETTLTEAIVHQLYVNPTPAQIPGDLNSMAGTLFDVFGHLNSPEQSIKDTAIALVSAFNLGTPSPSNPNYGYDLAYALYDAYTYTGNEVIEGTLIAEALKAAFTSLTQEDISEIIAEVYGIHTGSLTNANLQELATIIVRTNTGISDLDLAIDLCDQFYFTPTRRDLTEVAKALMDVCLGGLAPGRTTNALSITQALVGAFGLDDTGHEPQETVVNVAIAVANAGCTPQEVCNALFSTFEQLTPELAYPAMQSAYTGISITPQEITACLWNSYFKKINSQATAIDDFATYQVTENAAITLDELAISIVDQFTLTLSATNVQLLTVALHLNGNTTSRNISTSNPASSLIPPLMEGFELTATGANTDEDLPVLIDGLQQAGLGFKGANVFDALITYTNNDDTVNLYNAVKQSFTNTPTGASALSMIATAFGNTPSATNMLSAIQCTTPTITISNNTYTCTSDIISGLATGFPYNGSSGTKWSTYLGWMTSAIVQGTTWNFTNASNNTILFTSLLYGLYDQFKSDSVTWDDCTTALVQCIDFNTLAIPSYTTKEGVVCAALALAIGQTSPISCPIPGFPSNLESQFQYFDQSLLAPALVAGFGAQTSPQAVTIGMVSSFNYLAGRRQFLIYLPANYCIYLHQLMQGLEIAYPGELDNHALAKLFEDVPEGKNYYQPDTPAGQPVNVNQSAPRPSKLQIDSVVQALLAASETGKMPELIEEAGLFIVHETGFDPTNAKDQLHLAKKICDYLSINIANPPEYFMHDLLDYLTSHSGIDPNNIQASDTCHFFNSISQVLNASTMNVPHYDFAILKALVTTYVDPSNITSAQFPTFLLRSMPQVLPYHVVMLANELYPEVRPGQSGIWPFMQALGKAMDIVAGPSAPGPIGYKSPNLGAPGLVASVQALIFGFMAANYEGQTYDGATISNLVCTKWFTTGGTPSYVSNSTDRSNSYTSNVIQYLQNGSSAGTALGAMLQGDVFKNFIYCIAAYNLWGVSTNGIKAIAHGFKTSGLGYKGVNGQYPWDSQPGSQHCCGALYGALDSKYTKILSGN